MSRIDTFPPEITSLYYRCIGLKWGALLSKSEGEWIRIFGATHMRAIEMALGRFTGAIEHTGHEIESIRESLRRL